MFLLSNIGNHICDIFKTDLGFFFVCFVYIEKKEKEEQKEKRWHLVIRSRSVTHFSGR